MAEGEGQMCITIHPEQWCVYHHIKDGNVFYVGKGNAMRPFAITGRNDLWKAIALSGERGFEVEIVGWYRTSMDAFLAEQLAIREMKPTANITGLFDRKRPQPKDPYSERRWGRRPDGKWGRIDRRVMELESQSE